MIDELPSIMIVATTWFPPGMDGTIRFHAAERAIDSWARNLHYDGPLRLHVADDGSRGDVHTKAFGQRWNIVRYHLLDPLGDDVTYSRQDRRGVGASLNAGFSAAFEHGPISLYAVDDWSLTAPLDLTPWARLLMENETIGCVRLGPPHPNLRGTILMVEHGWVFVPEREGFAFGHRPALYHQRFTDYYGAFDEGVNAYECERLYNERYARDPGGPKVVLALPHPWRHLDSVELADVEPEGAML